jgi:hypothetical protein
LVVGVLLFVEETDVRGLEDDGLRADALAHPSLILALPTTTSSHLSLFFADVINVSGHRLSTAEIESALIMHKGIAETAGTFPPLLCLAHRC